MNSIVSVRVSERHVHVAVVFQVRDQPTPVERESYVTVPRRGRDTVNEARATHSLEDATVRDEQTGGQAVPRVRERDDVEQNGVLVSVAVHRLVVHVRTFRRGGLLLITDYRNFRDGANPGYG